MLFFEGSEKKVEIVFSKDISSLRNKGKRFWEAVVQSCQAQILSEISNEYCDAYLLSESSLFVWDRTILMITCGQTVLVNSVTKLLEEFGEDSIESIIFQRKNEYLSKEQRTTFFEDKESIERMLTKTKATSRRFGYLDEHHNFMLSLDRKNTPSKDDYTIELLMYHISEEASSNLCKENSTAKEIRGYLGIESFLNDFIVDDFVFDPFGYSLNAINGDRYITIHVTPQEGSSYVSLEMNLDIDDKNNLALFGAIIESLRPYSFDLISFSKKVDIENLKSYEVVSNFYDELECGHDVHFRHLIQKNSQMIKPFIIGDGRI